MKGNVNIEITCDHGEESALWSLQRMKSENGWVYPIRWRFLKPATSISVAAEILRRSMAGDKDFAPFKIVRLTPVKE